jgi:hypothetical protein
LRKALAGIACAVLLFGATACSDYNDERGRGDAPVAGKAGEDSAAFCTNMPDEFGNLCGKCVAHFPPWAAVVTTHYQSSSNVVLFQAPEQCGGAKVTSMPVAVSGSTSQHAKDDD